MLYNFFLMHKHCSGMGCFGLFRQAVPGVEFHWQSLEAVRMFSSWCSEASSVKRSIVDLLTNQGRVCTVEAKQKESLCHYIQALDHALVKLV